MQYLFGEKKKELSSAKDFFNGELVYKCKYFKLKAISSCHIDVKKIH